MAASKKKKPLSKTETTPPATKLRKPKPVGRPPGEIQRRKFDDTKVGVFMQIASPLEYNIIMGSLGTGRFKAPLPGVIRAVAKASGNKVFETKTFLNYIEYYEEHGIHQRRMSRPTPERIKRYTQMKDTADRRMLALSQAKIAKFKRDRGGL